jgi:hypothetical protein
MTKPKDETSTKLYATLWEDYAAQVETVDQGVGSASPNVREDEISAIQEMFRKDPRYALLVKHKFEPPTPKTKRATRADLDKMVESHGL